MAHLASRCVLASFPVSTIQLTSKRRFASIYSDQTRTRCGPLAEVFLPCRVLRPPASQRESSS